MGRKAWMAIGGSLVLVLCIGVAVALTKEGTAIPWQVEAIKEGRVQEHIRLAGEVRPKLSISIGSQITAPISAIHVREGDAVERGQLIVELDHKQFVQDLLRVKASLASAQNDLNRAQNTLEKRRSTLARIQLLFNQQLLSKEEYEQAVLNEQDAMSAVNGARAMLEQSQANAQIVQSGLEKTYIYAPISGQVTKLGAHVGEIAIPGTTNLPGAMLMTISDISEYFVEVSAIEADQVRLRMGQKAQIVLGAYPNLAFQGRITMIGTNPERAGTGGVKSYKVQVSIDGVDKAPGVTWLPGLAANLTVVTRELDKCPMIPLQAVLEREMTAEEASQAGLLSPRIINYVMVYLNGQAEERIIEMGAATSQQAQIVRGLSLGDLVVIGPSKYIKELRTGTRMPVPAEIRARFAVEQGGRREFK